MQLKHLSLLALASLVTAQGTQDLNATLAGNEQLSNLTTFVGMVPGLLETLAQATNITILAPSNDAFAEFLGTPTGEMAASDIGLLAAALSYHVLNGTVYASQITNMSTFVPTMLTNETYSNVTGGQVVEAVMVGDQVVIYSGLLQNSTVTTADVNFTGGVVHIIDSVLTLPVPVVDTALALNLTALVGAVNATDSVEAVTSDDVTIFAPNNEAFNSIGSALANLSSDDLAGILSYHIVDGVYYSSDLMNGTTVQTEDDDRELTITIVDETVYVNAAQVVVPNVLIANGVVHVIDNVLNPDNTAGPSSGATAGAPAISGSATGGLPFTSGLPTPSTMVNPSSAGPGPAQSSVESGPAMPMATGRVEIAALLGAGAAVFFGAA